MSLAQGSSSFIGGQFVRGKGEVVTSYNPAKDYAPVFETPCDPLHVDLAVESARSAFKSWSALSQDERNHALLAVKNAFQKHEEEIAQAIMQEMGKTLKESRVEAKSLGARVDLMIQQGLKRVATEFYPQVQAQARYHAQGALAVLGPYNFPAHLVNAHVIPALLTGNTVVVKPSEICPWTGELYARCIQEAGLPAGVFNMVQGRGDIGKSLALHNGIHGVLFTGSYATGHSVAEAVLSQPHKIVALEMGGKNIAVVLDDADLYQALIEIVQGAYLTTGQRCTATSRVLVSKKVANELIDALIRTTKNLKPGNPEDPQTALGPLATKGALERYLGLLKNAHCETLVPTETGPGGAFVTPSINFVQDKEQDLAGYLDTELFGPNLCVEMVEDLEEAIERVNQSAFGLSNAIFTGKKSQFEKFYQETRAGVLNWNRSTNGASGMLPFGGVGKSGNQRAAGIDAVRYTTFPVAINQLHFGESEVLPEMAQALNSQRDKLEMPLESLAARHELEFLLEKFGVPFDDVCGPSVRVPLQFLQQLSREHAPTTASFWCEKLSPNTSVDDRHLVISVSAQPTELLKKLSTLLEELVPENYCVMLTPKPAAVNVPKNGDLARSNAFLRRLYRDNFFPKEKKPGVIDLRASRGAYLASIDEDPMVIFDAASQIATIGVGFQAGVFQKALEEGELTNVLLANPELTDQPHEATQRFENLLLAQGWDRLAFASFVSSGAEANEKAFDLCRQNGPGGKRVIAFEGSFHGRTLISIQATYNPEKRAQFEFKGYEATFVPFPSNLSPRQEPAIPADWVKNWTLGEATIAPSGDELLALEIASLNRVREEILRGDICAVIIEPMQCEGGDNFGSARFFNGLRALTRGLKIPLIFDEVQTGFSLLGPFFAHTRFSLQDASGQVDGPDCVTIAKKAQVGACLSVWPDPRPQAPHIAQIIRGTLQAQAMLSFSPQNLEHEVEKRVHHLQHRFQNLVLNPRWVGYAFAFDLPNKNLANQLVNQRFYRGFMAYIAGEKTIRFRLNMSTTNHQLDELFEGLKAGLLDIESRGNPDDYVAPSWVDKPHAKSDEDVQKRLPPEVSIEALTPSLFDKLEPQIAALEAAAYEPNRQDSMPFLRGWLIGEGGLGLVVIRQEKDNQTVLGYAFGGPVENATTDGPKQDKMRGLANTFYSANIVLAKEARGLGLGFRLKQKQIESVLTMKKADGSTRYLYLTGRNRIGFTPEINRINRAFGAYTLDVFSNQYGEPTGMAAYYRIPLRRQHIFLSSSAKTGTTIVDWSASVQAPLGASSEEIRKDLENGFFTTAVGTKLTLSNWVTTDLVRYAELLQRLAPKNCRHAYFTSGRDETVDKGLRALRVSRPNADIAIGFTQQYVGHTTAAARSLSSETGQTKPFAWFDWPILPHPAEGKLQQTISQLDETIEKFSPQRILGIVVELIGERSGLVASSEFLNALGQVREQTGIPLVFVETASGFGRSGQTLFMSDSCSVKPNVALWYAGAQLGHVFVDDKYYVDKPLTLISTWDGDEISMRRTYRHLLVAQECLAKKTALNFETSMAGLKTGAKKSGRGLWHVLDFASQAVAQQAIERALQQHIRVREGLPGRVVICPPINITGEEIQEGFRRLQLAMDF